MRLRCDYVENPVSIGSPQPRLSWELKPHESGARLVADHTQADLPRPEPGKPLRLDFAPGEARYVRLTATDLC